MSTYVIKGVAGSTHKGDDGDIRHRRWGLGIAELVNKGEAA